MAFAGENVEVRASTFKDAGRGVFATKTFEPGDLIASVARPMVAELYADRLQDTCTWCCQRAATDPAERAASQQMGLPAGFIDLKSCNGCKRVRYCSKTCQTKDWKLEHKFECKFLAPPSRPILPPGVRAVFKLLKRLEKGDEAVQAMFKFQDKRQDAKRISPEFFDQMSQLSWGTWNYADKPSVADADAASHLFLTVIGNTLTMASALDDVKLGFAWDPLLCSVNHSCEPNAFYLFNQPKTVLRASKRIEKGEEIFIRYTDVNNPFGVRHAELKKTYYFDCACSKCERGPTLVADQFQRRLNELPAKWVTYADALLKRNGDGVVKDYMVGSNLSLAERRIGALQSDAFKIDREDSVIHANSVNRPESSSVEEVKSTLRMCLDSGMWSLTRQPVPSALHKLFAHYLEAQDMERALHIGLVRQFVVGPALQPHLFAERMLDTFALAQVAGSFASPGLKSKEQELRKKGCDLQTLYLSLLWTCWIGLDKSYGKSSSFGQVITRKWQMAMGGVLELTLEATTKLKDSLKEHAAYAAKIEVLPWII